MTITEQIKAAKAKPLLTVEEFALLVQLHPKSIYRRISLGKLAVVRIGRSIRVPISAARPVRDSNSKADQTMFF